MFRQTWLPALGGQVQASEGDTSSGVADTGTQLTEEIKKSIFSAQPRWGVSQACSPSASEIIQMFVNLKHSELKQAAATHPPGEERRPYPAASGHRGRWEPPPGLQRVRSSPSPPPGLPRCLPGAAWQLRRGLPPSGSTRPRGHPRWAPAAPCPPPKALHHWATRSSKGLETQSPAFPPTPTLSPKSRFCKKPNLHSGMSLCSGTDSSVVGSDPTRTWAAVPSSQLLSRLDRPGGLLPSSPGPTGLGAHSTPQAGPGHQGWASERRGQT